MNLPNGTYYTKGGSSVTISGKHGGVAEAEFDWFEEPHACIECDCDPYPQHDIPRWILMWSCEDCGGGLAELFSDEDCTIPARTE